MCPYPKARAVVWFLGYAISYPFISVSNFSLADPLLSGGRPTLGPMDFLRVCTRGHVWGQRANRFVQNGPSLSTKRDLRFPQMGPSLLQNGTFVSPKIAVSDPSAGTLFPFSISVYSLQDGRFRLAGRALFRVGANEGCQGRGAVFVFTDGR